MNGRGILFLVISTLCCAFLFLGCATVPQEALDEREAVIQNQRNQINSLNQEIARLQDTNKKLNSIKMELEDKLGELLEEAQQGIAAAPVKKSEAKMK